MSKKILAVIPARSGSKSIKNKNLIKIKNRTLINIAVTKAIKSKLFSKVLISTDSKIYALEAIKAGADILELRPKKLADEKTTLALVLKDILQKLIINGENYDNIISLQPTSPFLSINSIRRSVELFFNKNASGVATISKINDFHPLTAQKIDKNGRISFLIKPKNIKQLFPRQNRPNSYKFTGGLYLRKSINILNYKDDGWALGKNSFGLTVPSIEAVDINYPEDLHMLKYYKKNGIK
jgi:CMP-N,N'-diacetyllegionaminic acid synthase